MTRKEYETICKVLKSVMRSRSFREYGADIHYEITAGLAEAFDLKGDAKVLFLQKAGLPSR